MSDSAINHVLQIARLVRDGAKAFPGNAPATFLQEMKRIQIDSPEFYRIVSEIQKQLDDAQAIIESDDRMDAEGRQGLVHQLGQMRQMFTVSGITQNSQNYVQNPDVLVSQFAIIAGFYNSSAKTFEKARPEIDELIAETDQLAGVFESSYQPEAIKAVLRSHTLALRFFLSNIELLGFDAAYSAYFDLLVRLKRVEKRDPTAAAFVAEVWPTVERWAGRLAIIEGIVSNSEKLIDAADKIQRLLT